MEVIKKYIEIVRNLTKKVVFHIRMKQIDAEWYDRGGRRWGLFPPSFYYTHTEEEIERITAETRARIQSLLDQLGD